MLKTLSLVLLIGVSFFEFGAILALEKSPPSGVGHRCYLAGVAQEHASMRLFDDKANADNTPNSVVSFDQKQASVPVPRECRQ